MEGDYVLGEDVTEAARPTSGRVGVVLSPRFSPEEADAIFRAAELYGVGVVEFVRLAALGLARPATWDVGTTSVTLGNLVAVTRLSHNT